MTTIQHIVLLKFKEDASAEAITEVKRPSPEAAMSSDY